MVVHGWMINLSGNEIPVYSQVGACSVGEGTKIGAITKNECFTEGSMFRAGWEGVDDPVIFLNSSHTMTAGVIEASISGLVSFEDYASNGTSWVSVNTNERLVKYATKSYYADGELYKDLPAGSHVWLDSGCTRGETYPHYVAVTAVQLPGENKVSFDGNGFVDLTYDGRWINVGSILLRQA